MSVTREWSLAPTPLRYDAEVNREVAASLRAASRRARHSAQQRRAENQAACAEARQTRRRRAVAPPLRP